MFTSIPSDKIVLIDMQHTVWCYDQDAIVAIGKFSVERQHVARMVRLYIVG